MIVAYMETNKSVLISYKIFNSHYMIIDYAYNEKRKFIMRLTERHTETRELKILMFHVLLKSEYDGRGQRDDNANIITNHLKYYSYKLMQIH